MALIYHWSRRHSYTFMANEKAMVADAGSVTLSIGHRRLHERSVVGLKR